MYKTNSVLSYLVLIICHLAIPTLYYDTILWLYSQEMEYAGILALSELITGAVTYISVCGRGSADEQHSGR